MKLLFAVSLLINVFLGVLYFREVRQPPLERIVLEKSAPEVITKEVIVEKKVRAKTHLKSEVPPIAPFEPEAEKKIEEAVERAGKERTAFLTDELQLGQQELDQIEKIKETFVKKFSSVHPKGRGELTIEQRRQLLDFEVEREAGLRKVMGKSRWQRFQNFKAQYNKQRHEEAGHFGLVVPMEI